MDEVEGGGRWLVRHDHQRAHPSQTVIGIGFAH